MAISSGGGAVMALSNKKTEVASIESFEAVSQQMNETLYLKVNDAIAIVGFGLYLSWFYLTMTCSNGAGYFSQMTSILLVFGFLLGEAFCSLLVAFLAKHLAKRKRICILAVVSCVLLAMPSVVSIVPRGGEIIFFSSWFLSGVGAVLLLGLWGYFLAQLNHSQAPMYMACASLVAIASLILAKVFLREDMLAFACVACAMLSTMLYLAWAFRLWSLSLFVYPENVRPPDWRSLLHSAGAMVANSFLLGFGFYFLATSTDRVGNALILLGFLAAAVFKIFDIKAGNRYQVDKIIKVIAPVAAVCFLLMPFASQFGRFTLVFIMVFFAMIDEIVCWSAVSEYMHVHRVQPFANMAFGRFGDIVGLFLGFGSAYAIFGSSIEEAVSPSLFSSVVVIAFVVLQAFFFKDNYTPYIEHKDLNEELEKDYTVADGQSQGKGAWMRRCQLFAEYYSLTPRQTEVLFLLAKGRSSSYIEKQLVITNHTVKAHVYGIYQKADIHSRQELMERLEEFEDDGVRIPVPQTVRGNQVPPTSK